MARFLLKRLGLAVVTLFLLSVLVFLGSQVLPGNVARRILGPFADQRAVANLNHELGTDRPLLTQYWDWISHFVRGDLGASLAYHVPVSSLVGDALVNSLKLGAFAFVLVVPLAILGGVVAALKRDTIVDRVITLAGLSLTVVPEFVTGIILILVFALWIDVLPVSANAPDGSGPLTQLKYLVLPALTLVILLFGYIARITRAGTIESLDADYTRTAVLK
jgi:peptide/nickel transport system permease protein